MTEPQKPARRRWVRWAVITVVLLLVVWVVLVLTGGGGLFKYDTF